ncbi:MAG: DUF421 domain-containing protein [Bacilli bacterium]
MDYQTMGSVFIRSIVTIVVLFLLAKVMGKKQISQLNLFDYIVGITIGSVAADISLDLNKSFLDGVICMLVFGLTGALVSYVTLKSIKLRRFFTGTPSIIIENGKIIEEGLKKVKFDINDLMEELRGAGYFNIDEVAYAVMETNGKISFLPKDGDKPVTKKDMDLKIIPSSLVANIIIDGKIMMNNLKAMNKDEKWLSHELKVLGYKDIDEILLATLDSNDKIMVYKKGISAKYDTIFE